MQAFRNAAKPVVYLITITFLAWLIVDLSGLSGNGGLLTKTNVGTINGTSVDARIYQQAVQQTITQRQQETGHSLGLEETEQVRNDVWEQFVQNAVITDQIEKRHLSVSTDEIADAIRNVPPQEVRTLPDFQTEGKFDLRKYQSWLSSPVGQQAVPMLEARYRGEILQSKLMRNVTADVFLSDAAMWERYRDQHEQVRISLTAIIARNAVPDSAVTVTQAEVEAYYAAHKDEFKRPRTAFLSFVAVPRRIDASDSAAALEHAKEIRAEIVAGAPFAEVAKRESSDTGSARLGGDLGVFAKGAMVGPFDKAAFSMPLNTLSEPVLTDFGFHLIEVTKRTGDSATARHILIPIELAGAHRDLVDGQADTLERLAAEHLDPAALDTAARALKLPIGQSGPVQEGSRVLLGTYVIPDAGVWAFQAKVGETSPVIDGDAAFYVFRLDSMQSAGTPPLAQVQRGVTSVVMDAKKDAKAKAIATELERRLTIGLQLPEASKAMGLPNREFALFSRVNPPLTVPQVIGAAFGSPKGKPSPIIESPDGLYVIEVLEHVPADSAAFVRDKDQIRADMIRAARQDRVRQFLAALRADAKVKDERAALQRTNAQAEATAAAQASGKSR
ncbi:MAG: SurA N-terminal domain-containing protein [Gemmatimonadota bacterium]